MAVSSLTLHRADLGSGRLVDVRVNDAVIDAVGEDLRGDDWIDCDGGALLPGLHDHHVHLLATAAAADSVSCDVRSTAELAIRLRAAVPRAGWIRGVGYDDAVVGDLDRAVLDTVRADVPIRVQHRGGSLWVLNSAALAALPDEDVDGLERDAGGHPTGRLWRLDGWLARQLGTEAPDLEALSRRLASLGITGVTDATPDLSPETVRLLTSGVVSQRVTLLGDPDGAAPWKVVVGDHDLPDLDDLRARIEAVRPRTVALHCVTRVGLILAVAALRECGSWPGDRIEHAAVCSRDLAAIVASLGVPVVTQPSLVALRGDDYLDRVDPDDVDALWPFASLLRTGIGVGCSSDAPYGDLDPWRTIAAAMHRTAPSGRVVGPNERVSAEVALAGFLTSADDPGGSPREVGVGAPADLVLLDRPFADALRDPGAVQVRSTLIAGRVVYQTEAVVA